MITQFMTDAAHNAKVVGTVAAGTVTSGAATYLEYLPQILGVLASISGLILSFVLIYVNIRRDRREQKEYEQRKKLREAA
jgi:hypothetical protein